MRTPLENLARLHGIQLSYSDIWGKAHRASADVLRHTLKCMRVPCESKNDIEQSLEAVRVSRWEQFLPPVVVSRHALGHIRFPIHGPTGRNERYRWTLRTENRETIEGEVAFSELSLLAKTENRERRRFLLQQRLETGYHEIVFENGEAQHSLPIVVVPDQCFSPHGISEGRKTWGLSLQLYSLRSSRNWGMGDLGDLRAIVEQGAVCGVGAVGLNPLHALPLSNPQHVSPYSPTSRFAYHALYLDIEALDDFRESREAQELVSSVGFQKSLAAARAADFVDYEQVTRLKCEVLQTLFQSFQLNHLKKNSDRANSFRRFLEERGPELERSAEYEALTEHLKARSKSNWGWPVWPAEFQNPVSPVVRQFVASHSDRVQFYLYAQWLTETQLGEIGFLCLQRNMPLGLYTDLALGCDSGGADIWAEQEKYCSGLSMGAPPDELNLKGQSWGLTPFNPHKLRESAYVPLRRALRAAMRYAGVVRLDHVMSLKRIFCVPTQLDASHGVYLNYPLEELAGVVALESQRNQCAVVGEDLGTVPDSIRQVMEQRHLLSYKVFIFMKDSPTSFVRPDGYPTEALVTTTTHDLPTVRGFWTERDVDIRRDLDLFPKPEMEAQFRIQREQERLTILNALRDVCGWTLAEDDDFFVELSLALAKYLGMTPGRLALVQLEDLVGLLDQMNFPGVTSQYPCWRQKLPLDIDKLGELPALHRLAEIMRALGR